MFLELQRSTGRWRKFGDAMLAQVRNRLEDPCALQFPTGRCVTECRRPLWTVYEKEVWKVVDRQPETGRIWVSPRSEMALGPGAH